VNTALLLHTEVSWLSRVQVLIGFELRSEMSAFFVDNPSHLSNCLKSTTWLQKLAYFADIFMKTNELNLLLQGRNVSIFIIGDRICSFRCKLTFWTHSIERFPALNEFLSNSETELEETVFCDVIQHLNGL
jgi:hypothetical protein